MKIKQQLLDQEILKGLDAGQVKSVSQVNTKIKQYQKIAKEYANKVRQISLAAKD